MSDSPHEHEEHEEVYPIAFSTGWCSVCHEPYLKIVTIENKSSLCIVCLAWLSRRSPKRAVRKYYRGAVNMLRSRKES